MSILTADKNPELSQTSRAIGRIFAYNDQLGFGHIRLADNRRVWIRAGNLLRDSPPPNLGDIVEFDLFQSTEGLEARAARVLRPEQRAQSQIPHASQKHEVKHTVLMAEERKDPATAINSQLPKPKQHHTKVNTPQAQQLYEKAAIARLEGRVGDARRLFEDSIKAGAGPHVYSAFFKMESEKGRTETAKEIIQHAVRLFPEYVTFYDMYGQLERRAKNYLHAEELFRQGLSISKNNRNLLWSLTQVLIELRNSESLREAKHLVDRLEREGQINRGNTTYLRFKALQSSERAWKAYDFFDRIAAVRVGIAARRDLPTHMTDIVIEVRNPELESYFGLNGAILVRCFNQVPQRVELMNLGKYLSSLGSHGVIGLLDREVILNSSLAFVVIPGPNDLGDYFMSILGENNEVIVPLDDITLRQQGLPVEVLRDVLARFLGSRDLYNSTLPVSGRRFFGRERLLVELTEQIHQGQFLGIYGLRKMGKTSLIYQLRDEKLRGDAVAYSDLQASLSLTVGSCAPLYWELERDLYNRLRERQSDAAKILRLGKIERYSDLPQNLKNTALIFAEDIRELLEAIRSNRVQEFTKLVIVLDELERILPLAGQLGIDGYVEFFGLLRGLAQIERYRGLLSSVVVAANAAISERAYWDGRENPVFALYKPVFLQAFSRDVCVEMIRKLGKGMSVYWNDDAIDTVYAETGGHPFLTRALCGQLTRHHVTRPLTVTVDMVNAQILPFIRDEGDKLQQIVELLHSHFPDEEMFLEKIATDESPPDLGDGALRHLLGYQLIRSTETGYVMTLNLLRRWLRRKSGIKD